MCAGTPPAPSGPEGSFPILRPWGGGVAEWAQEVGTMADGKLRMAGLTLTVAGADKFQKELDEAL